ncbi:hypothetical protein [Clostridium sp. DJ247]|uniref:hypothetical protein n=1 Tax=Clostridium sp. DJ247 TaxID=2726188 RepID=UPI001624F3F5|nr:hypothetical protein [Clostridium sp. DJ247]MBC2579030.1 hypothetical protein [Clostridium sp. DJ247]
MSENTKSCQCCGDTKKTTLTEREKHLINLAYKFAVRDTASIKQSIVAAKSVGITYEDIKELCLITAENSKESILSIIELNNKVNSNTCCI